MRGAKGTATCGCGPPTCQAATMSFVCEVVGRWKGGSEWSLLVLLLLLQHYCSSRLEKRPNNLDRGASSCQPLGEQLKLVPRAPSVGPRSPCKPLLLHSTRGRP